MTNSEAVSLARTLLIQHNLGYVYVRLTNAKKQLGVARFKHKLPDSLGLSRHMIKDNPHDVIEDTILHEIAHFIAGIGAKHGPKWKAAARQVGADPIRCGHAVMPKAKWLVVCRGCNKIIGTRHRRTNLYNSKYHTPCGPDLGRLFYAPEICRRSYE